jgi:hypothetical protein
MHWQVIDAFAIVIAGATSSSSSELSASSASCAIAALVPLNSDFIVDELGAFLD